MSALGVILNCTVYISADCENLNLTEWKILQILIIVANALLFHKFQKAIHSI